MESLNRKRQLTSNDSATVLTFSDLPFDWANSNITKYSLSCLCVCVCVCVCVFSQDVWASYPLRHTQRHLHISLYSRLQLLQICVYIPWNTRKGKSKKILKTLFSVYKNQFIKISLIKLGVNGVWWYDICIGNNVL